MIGAAFSSFGISAVLMLECAANCCWNSDSAVGGSQVPAGVLTSFQLEENFAASTLLEPCANSVALLSVAAPFMKITFGLLTPHAVTQASRPWAMTAPTLTLSKET